MKNLQPTTYNPKPNSGFTLVETLVSISVFMVVMTVAAGSLLSIIDGNGKAQSIKSAVNNLNFAIESMAKEIRMGSGYGCAGTCTSGVDNISFTSYRDSNNSGSNDSVVYKLNGSLIERCVDGDTCQQMTAEEVKIESLKFYIVGTEPARILVAISGTAGGTKVKLQTTFNLQTTVSQRSF